MKASRKDPLTRTAVAAALLLAFGSAMAQDDAAQLTTPQSSIDVGAAYVDKDNQRFGEYNGLTDKGAYGIVDFSLVKRDDSTGTWFKLQGRNLGYKDPDLHLEQTRQGDWGYSVDYSRITRYEPFTVNTGLQGIGTTTETYAPITPGAGTDYQLGTKRDRWTLGLQKALYQWDVKVTYRNEEKDGTQLWGTGYFSVPPRFLVKPIDQTTQQIDVTADYSTAQYQIRAGYYGSMFNNKNSVLNVTNPVTNIFSVYGLDPDNQSHQFYVNGGYNFTEATRGTFKVSYARATQDAAWAAAPPPGVTQGSLGGLVDTTLLQGGLSGRATPMFNWRADLRYEDRDDKTPQTVLFATAPEGYQPRSFKHTTATVVGNYSLPMGFRLTGDITYDQKKREVPDDTIVNYRERVDETTARVEVRRAVSETVTGAVALLHSRRGGSDWLYSNNPDGNLVAPIYMADRDRDTGRVTVNWMATDQLTLNFRADASHDTYGSRNIVGYNLGPQNGKADAYSVDAAYTFTERVSGSAWYSHNEDRLDQATCSESNVTPNTCALPAPVFSSDLRNIADSYGLGLRGKLTSKIDVGADLTDSKVRDEYHLAVLAGSTTAAPLNDITTKVTTLRLYGKYALNRQSGVRLDYTYDNYRSDDWTWANWIYGTADGTTVLQNPNQKVNFVGVSYYYKFH
ncbi:MAG: MtrB/PioB family decaheme-associated outer membrane protein [Burkholderiales bacterium]